MMLRLLSPNTQHVGKDLNSEFCIIAIFCIAIVMDLYLSISGIGTSKTLNKPSGVFSCHHMGEISGQG